MVRVSLGLRVIGHQTIGYFDPDIAIQEIGDVDLEVRMAVVRPHLDFGGPCKASVNRRIRKIMDPR